MNSGVLGYNKVKARPGLSPALPCGYAPPNNPAHDRTHPLRGRFRTPQAHGGLPVAAIEPLLTMTTTAPYTIRNKATRPIATLRPTALNALLQARPEASTLALAKLYQDYAQLTGKQLSLDHEQRQLLLHRFGANEQDLWHSAFSQLPHPWFVVKSLFSDGFMRGALSKGLLEDLSVARAFFDMLAQHMGLPVAAAAKSEILTNKPKIEQAG